MTILVSDTSVIIDLERGQLLEPCFRLPHQFAVPDLLFERELAEQSGPELVALGLRVEELTSAELTAVQTVRRARPKLSLPDSYAYALASGRQWTLLTGDGELRALAEAQAIPYFGVLWVAISCSMGKSLRHPRSRMALRLSRHIPGAACRDQKSRSG
jgi:hypothetical protein